MISIKKRIICSIRRNKRDKKVSTPTAGAFTIWKCANVAGGSGKQEILVVMPRKCYLLNIKNIGYRKVMRALAHLRSEVKDFFDFAIDPILLVRKQKGLEKVPTSCNSVCQLLSYVLRGR